MERIEGIKILHVDGLSGVGHGGTTEGRPGLADDVASSALRYRVQALLIDQLFREIGIEWRPEQHDPWIATAKSRSDKK